MGGKRRDRGGLFHVRMIIRYSSSVLSFYQAGENQALVFMGGIGGK